MPAHVENRKIHARDGIRLEDPRDLTLLSHEIIAVLTNGTTPVNVFSPKGASFKGTITGVFVIAQDTTAGNITPKVGGNTVVTIAKGTTSGGMTGGGALSNINFVPGQSVQIVSSSAGNALVFITYSITT